jgi:hypothetical protein
VFGAKKHPPVATAAAPTGRFLGCRLLGALLHQLKLELVPMVATCRATELELFFLTQILFFFLDSTRMKEGAVYLSFLSKS